MGSGRDATARQSANAAGFSASEDDVFHRIAGRYDLLCDLFSIGLHRLWKRRAAELILSEPWQTMLDVASGTGDVALRVDALLGADVNRTIVLTDLSPAMLSIAARRAAGRIGRLALQLSDAHTLHEFESDSFDSVVNSLALKICDRHRVLGTAYRVLCPGGRLVVLEASRIEKPLLMRVYLGYMSFCMPVIGWIATGGDASAYRYLLEGVRGMPDAEALAAEMRANGFEDVGYERHTLGIVAIHIARKPLRGETP